MKLYYFDVLSPRKACAVARHLKLPIDEVPEVRRRHDQLDVFDAWREPFP